MVWIGNMKNGMIVESVVLICTSFPISSLSTGRSKEAMRIDNQVFEELVTPS